MERSLGRMSPTSSCEKANPPSCWSKTIIGEFTGNYIEIFDSVISQPSMWWEAQGHWCSGGSTFRKKGRHKGGVLLVVLELHSLKIKHCWWECKLTQPQWLTVWRFLKKLRIKLPYMPTTGHIPWENHNWKRHMYSDVHCSTIYNS